MSPKSKIRISILCSILTFVFLIPVQVVSDPKLLLFERFFTGGGWIQIIIISVYAGILFSKMSNPLESAKWRKISWLTFSIIFFSQAILGIFGSDIFLMTGKLHFPIPGLIVGGALYRMQLSFMPIFFVSTLILSGPAWCSHICYFGAIDNWIASQKRNKKLKKLWPYKLITLLLMITVPLLLRYTNAPTNLAIILSSIFGITGLLIIILLSKPKGSMTHCIAYCPIGTIVNITKYISPFRFKIDKDCCLCMKCTKSCNYNALTVDDIKKGRPGITCTYCGDCVSSCHSNSLHYSIFNLSPSTSRTIWLVVTVVLHSLCIAVAKI